MVQKKRSEKTADDLQAERVTAALEETDRTGRVPTFVRENPGQFLRDMYEVWHRQGGKEGGRWRNSIRKMRDEWLVGRNAVPSLHPKLMGRVKVTRSDVRALLDLFLTRWRYGEGDDALSSMTRDGYVGFEAKDRQHLRSSLVRTLFVGVGGGSSGGWLLPRQEHQGRPSRGDLRIQTFIENEYQSCDALITFSRNRIAVGPTPPETMKNFFFLFNAFYEQSQSLEDSKCIFIWIVDLGKRLFEDTQSFKEFFNAGFLSLLLRSFAEFDSEKDDYAQKKGKLFRQLRIFEPNIRQKRWKWLAERSVVIAENLRWEDMGEKYSQEEELIHRIRLRDSGVTVQHVLPLEIPHNWNVSVKRVIGRDISFGDISYTALLNRNGWSRNSENDYLRFVAHIRSRKNSDIGTSQTTLESIELPSAGKLYEEALRIVYFAALHRLTHNSNLESEEMTAVAYLRKLGFHVLSLDDFVGIFRADKSHESVGGS